MIYKVGGGDVRRYSGQAALHSRGSGAKAGNTVKKKQAYTYKSNNLKYKRYQTSTLTTLQMLISYNVHSTG